MVRVVTYRGLEIHSHPHRISEGKFRFSVSGHVPISGGSFVEEHLAHEMGIPDNRWLHITEEEADDTFIEFATRWIDDQFP